MEPTKESQYKGQYKLKKDTPKFKAGSIFSVDNDNTMWDPNSGYYAILGGKPEDGIEDFDEWFEKVENDEWPRRNDIYVFMTTSGEIENDICNEYRLDKRRKKIGNCFKTEQACQNAIDFLTAVETVSHDKGFMVPYKTSGKIVYGFGVSRDWNGIICAEGEDHQTVAGQLYFDSEENAATSLETHLNEWKIIMNYDWSKGEDENEG